MSFICAIIGALATSTSNVQGEDSVSPLSVSGSFSDQFDYVHDFVADGVDGTGWDRITGVQSATGPRIEARNGVLHMTSSGTAGDANPLSIARGVPAGVDLQATVQLVDAPSQGNTFERSYVNFSAPMLYIGRSDDERGVSHYVSHHFFEAFNFGNGMQVVENFNRTHDGSFTSAPGYPWMRIEFEHQTARVTAWRSLDGEVWEEFGSRTLDALISPGATLEIGLIHAVWGGNPDPDDAYIEWDNFEIRELFENLEITMIEPQEGFDERDDPEVTFVAEVIDRGGVGIESVSLVIDGEVIATDTSGQEGIYTFVHELFREVIEWEIVAYDLAGERYGQSRRLIRDLGTSRSDIGEIPRESLHRSSRRTGLVISEIMYRTGAWADGRTLEFVELYNSEPTPADIGGWRLGGEIRYVFPQGTVIPGEGFLVVAASPGQVEEEYGLSGVLGGYEGSLDRNEGEVLLYHRNGGVLLEAAYSSVHPWPAAAGAGHSLVLARPSYGEGSVAAWEASRYKGGSPGAHEPETATVLDAIRINELLARDEADEVNVSFVELYNHSREPVDLSGAFLSDRPDAHRFQIPQGVIVPAGGFLAYDETELGFSFDASGGGVYLVSPGEERVIDALRYEALADDVSLGRFPDGAPEFRRLAEPTPGSSNSGLFNGPIVISEIMFNPISGSELDTYVELYNRGEELVDLSGWRFAAGIRFTFPAGTSLAPGGYLVVARDRNGLIDRYPSLNSSNTVGNFGGRLSNSGERLALAMPVLRPSGGIDHVVVNEVTYRDGGRWGEWANRDGSSIELRDPRSDNRRAANWTHSGESEKGEWTLIEHIGVMSHGSGPADQLHILLPSAGHTLIDEVEVRVDGGPNLVMNGTFDSGIQGWLAQGHHVTSHWSPDEGFQTGGSLRLEASGSGDTGANRVRVQLANAIPSGSTVALRARARWIAGHPQVLLRLRGNYLEVMGDLHVPSNLGTPGAPNSAHTANAGPAIYDARHVPVLPAANQPVAVTARAHDPDGVSGLILHYRIDPTGDYTAVPMLDDGEERDAVAGDGVFTAVIPGQAADTLIAYYIEAVDEQGATATYPENPSEYEALIRFGDRNRPGSYLTYHMWFTDEVMQEWANREVLSNRRLPGTLVYGNRVIHNIGARYRGSPWRRPTGFSFQVPRDDRLLGTREFNLNGIHHSDSSAQRELMGYWIAEKLGLAFSHQTYIHLYRNGRGQQLGANVFTDIQHIESEYLQSWFPDDDGGELFKIDDWFEFTPTFSFTSVQNARLLPYREADGTLKQARYRWSWNKRSNRWLDDDYSSLFQLVEAVNTEDDAIYTAAVESVADVEQWMRVFAIRRIVSDWDGYGYNRGKNAWTYKPERGPWQMILWDLDKGIGADNSSPTASLFGADDPVVVRMYNHPPFRRAYWRAFNDAVHGPLLAEKFGARADANYAAFVENGLNVTGTQPLKDWINTRRNYLINQLNTVQADLAINSTEVANGRVELSGVAPVGAHTLTINGAEYSLIWDSETEWRVTLPLTRGQNHFVVQSRDSSGELLDETSTTVNLPSTPANPVIFLSINEILYHPVAPRTEFVEIHNTSAEHAFSLGGYRLDELDFTFPQGTLIEPGAFLLVVRDRTAFQNAFGVGWPIAGEFSGAFPQQNEGLRFLRPATDTVSELLLDQVYYLPSRPWPSAESASGGSYQRVDPAQSGDHPGNWVLATPTPGETNSVREDLPAFASLWLNELQAVNTGVVTDAFGEFGSWVELYYAGSQSLNLDGFFLSDGADDLAMWAFPPGATIEPATYALVWLDGQSGLTGADEWHTSFAMDPDVGELYLSRDVDGEYLVIDAVGYDGLPAGHSVGRHPDGAGAAPIRFSSPTPGAPNAIPPLSLLHYWNFNDSEGLLHPSYTVGDALLVVDEGVWGEVLADDGQGFAGANARFGDPAGTHLRFNFPLVGTLTVGAPMIGHRDITLSYEASRSGQGAGLHIVEYSADGDLFVPFAEVVVTENPVTHTIDFGAVAEVVDNPELLVRIRFEQGEGGTEGNNRFDNLTLEGRPLEGASSPPKVNPPAETYRLVEGGASVQIDLSEVFISTDENVLDIAVESESADVFGITLESDILTIDPRMRGDGRILLTADNNVHPAVSAAFRVIVFPSAHPLNDGVFSFDAWSPDEPAGSYPQHMLFVQSAESDTGIATPLDYAYRIPPGDAADPQDIGFPYRAESRTRINGLEDDGISFINTGRGRDLGGALLALDTRGVEYAPVNWLAGTVLPNERVYAIRLQYRVGMEGEFSDLHHDNGEPVEYVRNATPGHVMAMASVLLPPEALGEEYVQVLWRYYRVSGDSGPRAQLRLDDIRVANTEPGVATSLVFAEQPPEWSQSGKTLPPVVVRVVDESGQVDTGHQGQASLEIVGEGILEGVLNAAIVNGVAVFDEVSAEGAGVFALMALSNGLESAQSDPFNLVRVREEVMPRYMQGNQDQNNDNNDRVPFTFRLKLEGLKPEAEYRYGNRVITPDDPADQNGAGNAILVTGSGSNWIRNTDSPRFRPGDYGLRHLTFTTDENGAYAGWFVTEPTGNRRFEPGNTVFIRLLLNDGAGGEELFHFLDTRGEIQVIAFGEGANQGSGLTGESEIGPRNIIVYYDNLEGDGRPLGATPVEVTGSAIDSRYASFYHETVATADHRWGGIFPNNLTDGVRRIEERRFNDGAVYRVYEAPDGFPGTVEASGGLDPLRLDLLPDLLFARFDDWRNAMFEEPLAESSGPDGDPSGQGVKNLLRYAFGMEIDEPPYSRLPRLEKEDGDLSLRFHLLNARTDIVYLVEATGDLEDWSETLFDSRIDDTGTGNGLFEIKLEANTGNQMFYRLRILME